MNNQNNEELLQEINELKENYFVLIKTIQENNTNKNTNNIADELGFLDEIEEKPNNNVNVMVDELLANVNRISLKLQENNSSIEKINQEIVNLSNKDTELSNLINNTLNDINNEFAIVENTLNNYFDKKFNEE